MIYNSFFEQQQNPAPGPLDAEYHILQLPFGGDNALQPQELLLKSQEVSLESVLTERGFYTDIPPRLGATIEESEHTIEVAVRRSFDFMKLPLIIGGSNEILPAVFRGIEGQVADFIICDASSIQESEKRVVITFDADNLPAEDQNYTPRSHESIAAVIVTGTSGSDATEVLQSLLNYLRNGIA